MGQRVRPPPGRPEAHRECQLWFRLTHLHASARLTHTLGRSRSRPKYLGLGHPCGSPGWSSCLLAAVSRQGDPAGRGEGCGRLDRQGTSPTRGQAARGEHFVWREVSAQRSQRALWRSRGEQTETGDGAVGFRGGGHPENAVLRADSRR